MWRGRKTSTLIQPGCGPTLYKTRVQDANGTEGDFLLAIRFVSTKKSQIVPAFTMLNLEQTGKSWVKAILPLLRHCKLNSKIRIPEPPLTSMGFQQAQDWPERKLHTYEGCSDCTSREKIGVLAYWLCALNYSRIFASHNYHCPGGLFKSPPTTSACLSLLPCASIHRRQSMSPSASINILIMHWNLVAECE